ncbi:sulfatase [Pontiellaceae bacterium B12227]|nr:sulfatase [Pontiellaceae bacterium B12227]
MKTSNHIQSNRRNFLGGMGTAALALSATRLQAAAASRPNLLFVLVDQWRFSSFSHGEVNDAKVQTPNIDSFLNDSLRWRKAYSTSPVCTPERAVLMTGRYPHQTGMTHNDLMLPPGNRCLAEIFTEAGYATHYIGKTHYDGEAKPGFIPPGWRRRGFTTYEGYNRGHDYMPGRYYDNDGNLIEHTEYEPAVQRQLAEQFISSNKARPWFCFLSWGVPHTPYAEVPSQYKTYSLAPSDLRPNVPGTAAPEADLENYFAHCTAADDNFGQLMQFLEDTGLRDNTLVVFTSDHGDMHFSHNLEKKGHAEEESAHIPLFMRMPGVIPSGAVSDTLINGVDMMPTLLSLCGLPNQKTCAGVDKSDAAKGLPMPGIDSIFCPHQDDWRMVRSGQYKLIVRDKTDPMTINSVTDLYDLDNDPYEMANLVADPAHAAVKQQLYNRLVQWIADTDDPWPQAAPQAGIMYTT